MRASCPHWPPGISLPNQAQRVIATYNTLAVLLSNRMTISTITTDAMTACCEMVVSDKGREQDL